MSVFEYIAAFAVLSGSGTTTPKLACGQIEAMRLIKIARDSAVKARTTTIICLRSVLVTASDELRLELEPLSEYKLIVACAALEADDNMATPSVAVRHTLSYLATSVARRNQGS